MREGRGGDGYGGAAGGSKGKLTLERVCGIKKQQIGGDESAAAALRKCEVHRYTKEVNGEEGGVEGVGAAAAEAPSKHNVGGGSSRWCAKAAAAAALRKGEVHKEG